MSGRRVTPLFDRTIECRCIWPCANSPEAVAAAKAALDVNRSLDSVLTMALVASLNGRHRWRSPAELNRVARG